MMPSKTWRKPAPPPSPPATVLDCALELRKIGDKWDVRQKLLNLVAKLFCPGT